MAKDASSKTIEDLEGIEWPSPPPNVPPSIRRCYEARRKPLRELRAVDLRLLVAQGTGLPFVVPTALEILEKALLLEAEHYRGDLLVVVLRLPPDFFRKRPDLRMRVEHLLARLPAALKQLDHIDFDTSSEALEEAERFFREARGI